MTPELEALGALIADTPGAAAQLALARTASLEGRHAESQVHVAIAADAVAALHPVAIPDPIVLRDVLGRLFLE